MACMECSKKGSWTRYLRPCKPCLNHPVTKSVTKSCVVTGVSLCVPCGIPLCIFYCCDRYICCKCCRPKSDISFLTMFSLVRNTQTIIQIIIMSHYIFMYNNCFDLSRLSLRGWPIPFSIQKPRQYLHWWLHGQQCLRFMFTGDVWFWRCPACPIFSYLLSLLQTTCVEIQL